MSDVKYGRGKFEPPKTYIQYINMIADSPVYSGLPAIREPDGKINWQCSSGKTTSFYKNFEGRFRWWVNKADELGIPGTENSDDRLTIAARMIHPTKKKVCLVCGRERYVGYMYINSNLAKAWNSIVGKELFQKIMPVHEATQELINSIGIKKTREIILHTFPEKKNDIILFDHGQLEAFFSKTQFIRTTKLSPGYMGDCPHRLDGIHDYCLYCRKKNDPGRSDENMRTYNHDRRAFMWWAEGDWKTADTLYNSATSGTCINCGETVSKISPDHVGPLSCGFKQNAFFEPLCGRCNSAKNRRFTFDNVLSLIDYERKTKESVASWQVRSLWDKTKAKMVDDNSVKILSNYMRAMQDYYLRMIKHITDMGYFEFPSCYLHPEYAHYNVEFAGLNTSTLSFSDVVKNYSPTHGTRSLAARSVRIAFEELTEYCAKTTEKRKSIILKTIDSFLIHDKPLIDTALSAYTINLFDKKLLDCMKTTRSQEQKDTIIQSLIEQPAFIERHERFHNLKTFFETMVNDRGAELAETCLSEIGREQPLLSI